MFGSILLLGGLLLAQAETKPPQADLEPQVRKLVRQLDAPQLKQRDAAEEELLRLGPAVLVLLPADADAASAEVAQRLARIRQKLQRAQAESAVQPSRVTLRGTMPLSKCLAAIAEQTGNKIVDVRREAAANVPDPEVKADFDKTPFWQALDRVLDQAGLAVYPFGENHTVHVVLQPGEEGARTKRAIYSGPFRFEPVSILAERDLRNPASRSLKLEVEVAWEPRLRPITLVQRLADLKALDDTGQPLPIPSGGAELEAPVPSGPIAQKLIVPLAPPPREVKRISRLTGVLHVVVPGQPETFRFKDLEKAKNVKRRVANVTVAVEDVFKNNKLWEVAVLVVFDNPREALASHRNWVFGNPAYLEGPDGKAVPYASIETTKQTENEVGVGYLFDAPRPLAEYTFVYKTPTMIFSVPVPYEFKDIPLP